MIHNSEDTYKHEELTEESVILTFGILNCFCCKEEESEGRRQWLLATPTHDTWTPGNLSLKTYMDNFLLKNKKSKK